MRREQVRAAVHKMQRSAVNIEEDLATYVDGLTGLWIPPAGKTEVIRWIAAHNCYQLVHEASLTLGIPSLLDEPRENVRSVWYPVPDHLNGILCEGKDPDIQRNGAMGFQECLESEGWHYRMPKGIELKSLVRDFLNLANIPLDGLGEPVRKFVLKWGPLWCCMEHTDCCWAPITYSPGWYSYRNKCRWFCSEPAVLFKAKARQAEAAITIAGYLSEGEHAPIELWKSLTFGGLGSTYHFSDGHIGTLEGRTKHDLWVQQRRLIEEINRSLTSPLGPTFRTLWSHRQHKPVIFFDTGLGFFRLVWLQIAQSLCGGKGIYKCDSCLNYYIPDRKPPDGRHHFCPACGGEGKKGAKRLYARRKRREKQIINT